MLHFNNKIIWILKCNKQEQEMNNRAKPLLSLLFLQAGLKAPLFTTQTVGPAVSPWRKPSAGWSKTPSANTCWSTFTMEPESLCRCRPTSRVTGCPPGKQLWTHGFMFSVHLILYEVLTHKIQCNSPYRALKHDMKPKIVYDDVIGALSTLDV